MTKKFHSKMIVYTILAINLGLAACTNPDGAVIDDSLHAYGIIGGKEPVANSVAFKSTVAIGDFDKSEGRISSFCTGVVISKDLVLTAAHCMDSKNNNSQNGKPTIYMYFGNAYKNYDKKLERISTHWQINDKYKEIWDTDINMIVSASGDVALIKVEGGVPATAVPIPLGINSNLKKGEQITAAGWGIVHEKHEKAGFTVGATEEEVTRANTTSENDDEDKPTDRLYETNISFLSIWKTHLIFQQSEKTGVCSGDSGGPAYYKSKQHGYVAIGLVRGAFALQDCSSLVEYTNLTYNIDFIKKAVAKLGGSPPKIVNLKK